MKFTEQLKFNSVPEWKEYYVNYSQLKGIIDNICRIESRAAASATVEDEEQHLLGGSHEEGDQEFIKALDKELAKCIAFFFRKESDLHGKYESVFLDIHGCEGLLVTSPEPMSVPEVEEAKRQQRVAFWQRHDNELQRETLKQKMQDLFVHLNGLVEFLELNYAGFRKIVKKHDKLTSSNLKDVYQPILNAKLPMTAKPQLRDMIKSLEAEYATVCRDGELQRTKLELSKQLKDKVGPGQAAMNLFSHLCIMFL
jgi:phosphate transporter